MVFRIASSPYTHNQRQTSRIMMLVCLAALPGIAVQCWFFGWGTLFQIALGCASAVAAEALVLKLRKMAVSRILADNSALLTGLLLAARPDVALRHHIDGLGGPPRPDDIFAGGGVQPRRHALAGRLIALGQPLGGGELTAVDVAGAQAIKLVAGVDHRLRFERRRRAVEIDAGIGQSRKLRAKVRRVECVHGIPRINTAIVAQFVGRDKASALCGIVRM